ncbi:MAG: UDP pyrophosphate synthase [delta proteobacterium ML8_F1]|nr:MAG: UDP pyrophosphate synthase [delta proteobacterium ML8_F1]
MDQGLKIPRHVAFIMDGNGRWAKKRNLPRSLGHKAGTENIRKIIAYAKEKGIGYLTFYAFSTENWKRPQDEIQALMKLLKQYLMKEVDTFNKEGVRLCTIGSLEAFSPDLVQAIEEAREKTAGNRAITVIIALNYGSRQEIVRGVNRLIAQGKSEITEEDLNQVLYTRDFPDPDLLVRTSGELRLSNFLLWQLAYTELLFTPEYWPDFNEKSFEKALEEYTRRDRRYGGLRNA